MLISLSYGKVISCQSHVSGKYTLKSFKSSSSGTFPAEIPSGEDVAAGRITFEERKIEKQS